MVVAITRKVCMLSEVAELWLEESLAFNSNEKPGVGTDDVGQDSWALIQDWFLPTKPINVSHQSKIRSSFLFVVI